jgi:hypothetical protein
MTAKHGTKWLIGTLVVLASSELAAVHAAAPRAMALMDGAPAAAMTKAAAILSRDLGALAVAGVARVGGDLAMHVVKQTSQLYRLVSLTPGGACGACDARVVVRRMRSHPSRAERLGIRAAGIGMAIEDGSAPVHGCREKMGDAIDSDFEPGSVPSCGAGCGAKRGSETAAPDLGAPRAGGVPMSLTGSPHVVVLVRS